MKSSLDRLRLEKGSKRLSLDAPGADRGTASRQLYLPRPNAKSPDEEEVPVDIRDLYPQATQNKGHECDQRYAKIKDPLLDD